MGVHIMRVARMGYTQRVTKKDSKGRITSSWVRVRKVVPEGLALSLPPPYTGKKTLTKKVSTEREHAEWTAKFLAIIDQAAGRTSVLRELAGLDGLNTPDLLRQCPSVIARFDNLIGLPAPVAKPSEPVTFEWIIPKWAKLTNAPKKGIQNMETKSGRFVAWLGHDDMAKVTFENCRDYRDFLIEESDLSSTTILNHLKALKRLFGYAYENDYLPTNHWQRVKYKAGDGEEREDFTSDERCLILTLAREAGPVIKWCNWLSSFQAARLSEILDAHTCDIVVEEGVPVMKIRRKYRSPDQRLKTKVSTRTSPLHSAVLGEGFLITSAQSAMGRCFHNCHSTLTVGGRVRRQAQSPSGCAMSLASPTPTSPSTAIAIPRSAICATRSPPRVILRSKRISNDI
jgi:hypothetical protein